MRSVVMVLALASAGVAGGCVSRPEASGSNAAPGVASGGAAAEVAVPPKELVGRIRQAVSSPPISVPVESAQDGVIVTGWTEHRGNFHIARYWKERTRFRIEVSPDWNEPLNKSKVRVTEETQERASDKEDWQAAPELQRPQRSRDLLGRIVAALGSK